jgi:hypothetical protein
MFAHDHQPSTVSVFIRSPGCPSRSFVIAITKVTWPYNSISDKAGRGSSFSLHSSLVSFHVTLFYAAQILKSISMESNATVYTGSKYACKWTIAKESESKLLVLVSCAGFVPTVGSERRGHGRFGMYAHICIST